jgi:hypothetical protein
VGVLVIYVLVVIVFCVVCTLFSYCIVYVYLFSFVLSVLVYGLLQPSKNSIAVSSSKHNNNNNNNNT